MAAIVTLTWLLATTAIVLVALMGSVNCATNCTGIITLEANETGDILASEDYVTSPDFLQQDTTDPTKCELHISSGSNSSVVVVQSVYFQMDENGNNCINDRMEIYDGSSTNSSRLGLLCGLVNGGTYNSTGSDLTIVFTSNGFVHSYAGFKFYYYTKNKTRNSIGNRSQCQNGTLINEGNTTYLVSPNYPKSYPSNTYCSWPLTAPSPTQVVVLKILTLHLEKSPNACDYDSLALYNGRTRTYPLIDKMCGTVAPIQFKQYTSTGQNMTVEFRSDESGNYEGFKLEYSFQANTALCGNSSLLATGAAKNIKSPGYPNNYPNNADCQWTITAAISSQVILLKLVDFNLEGSTIACTYDYVRIFDGPNTVSVRIQNLCGQVTIPQFVSSGPSMTLVFHSDSTTNSDGFKFEYTAVEKSAVCSNNSLSATVLNQYITSPSYPNEYPRNMDCLWSITSSVPSRVVMLKIMDFYLEGPSSSCPYDNLTIYDGPTTSSPRILILCGQVSPTEFVSSGPTMTFAFHTDSSTGYSGFQLQYIAQAKIEICTGDTLHATSISSQLNSPNYPGLYPSNTDCEWHITADYSSSVISLDLTKFSLEGYSSSCYSDYVKIYDGPSRYSRLIDTLCGSLYYGSYESTGSDMTVVFHSDGGSNYYTGFSFNYQYRYKWSSTSDFSHDNTGPIVAIVICSIAVPFLIVLFIILVRRRMARKRQPRNTAPFQNGMATTMPVVAYVANNQQGFPTPYVMMQNPQMMNMGGPYYNASYLPPPYSYAMPPGAVPQGQHPPPSAPGLGPGPNSVGVDPAQGGGAQFNMGLNNPSNNDVVKTPLGPDDNSTPGALSK